ncbi:MAG: amino acid permease [Candidatus Melainabacteria bacterium]|nr:amino acid permease [Candidatus Melainabacteria bacterium]
MSQTVGTEQQAASFLSKLFRRKNLDAILAEQDKQAHKLERSLTAFDLVIFGVGAMIGAGIFVMTGSAAAGSDGHLAAGPALTLSFVLTGIVCTFCALCYSEFAAMAPISGSAYTYAFSTLGEFVAWIIGWALVLEYAVGNMAVAVGWTGSIKEFINPYLQQYAGFTLPTWLTSNTVDTVSSMSAIADPSLVINAIPVTIPFIGDHDPLILLIQRAFNLPAFLVVLAVTLLLLRGVSESARTAAVMVFTKTLVILLFIGVGFAFLFGGNMPVLQHNWFANGWTTFAPNGFAGILTGASTIFFAYIGFDAVATAAEETKNPQRDIPIGIIGSLAICTVLYILVTSVITGVVPLTQINREAAVVGAMLKMGIEWASLVVSIGAIAGLTSVLLVLQMAGVRIFYAIARDGLLPKMLATIDPKFHTPSVCTILVGIFVALGSGLLPINLLAEMCNIGTLGAFLVVCLGVAILRYTDPKRHRPFRVPFGLLFPILGIAGCVFVMSGLPLVTWIVTGLWFLLGMVIYFSYGFWNSALAKRPGIVIEESEMEVVMHGGVSSINGA